MNRRQVLATSLLSLPPLLSAEARSIGSAPLASLCKRAAVIALVEDFTVQEIRSSVGDCGPKVRAKVLATMHGRAGRALEWRGMSVFNEAQSYVVFPASVRIADQVSHILLGPSSTERRELQVLVRSCEPLQVGLLVSNALPILPQSRTRPASVLVARDADELKQFADAVPKEMLEHVGQGFAVSLQQFAPLVKRLADA